MKSVIVGIFILSCFWGQARSEQEHFFSHLIIAPIVESVKGREEVSSEIGDAMMGKITEGSIGHIHVKKSLTPEASLIVSYPEVPDTHLTVFRENGIIVRVIRNQNGVETDFVRPELPSAATTPEVFQLTSERLREAYLAEDLNFGFADSGKIIAVEILAVQVIESENHVVARIGDGKNAGIRLIQYRDDSLFGSSKNLPDSPGALQLCFAVHLRLGDGSILLDSYVRDENGDSYSCHYYRNGFLKDMVTMRQGKWEKQKVWTAEGILSGEYDYPPGRRLRKK